MVPAGVRIISNDFNLIMGTDCFQIESNLISSRVHGITAHSFNGLQIHKVNCSHENDQTSAQLLTSRSGWLRATKDHTYVQLCIRFYHTQAAVVSRTSVDRTLLGTSLGVGVRIQIKVSFLGKVHGSRASLQPRDARAVENVNCIVQDYLKNPPPNEH